MQYISQDAQIPPVDPIASQQENTAVSKKVLCIDLKGEPHIGYYYHELKCWKLENGYQPERVKLWAFIPPIDPATVILTVDKPYYT